MNNHKCPASLPPGQPIVVGQLVADVSKPQYTVGRIKVSTVPYSQDSNSESFQPFRIQFKQDEPALTVEVVR